MFPQFKINEFGDLELVEESATCSSPKKELSSESVSADKGDKQVRNAISTLKVKKTDKKQKTWEKNRYSGE